ncbi:rhodanese-like domain-containing protein [Bdellovibrio sp. HCB185ZH]|uniref:rhodanese-like domain-containing protein n=1 Tax=Bdellovibrio sp. HCB185ZH TaxID=3394235 RepID=UPI0039A67BCB
MDISQLGYFQFNNLIKGRIPMILVNLGVDLKSLYGHVEALHIDNCQIAGSTDEIVSQIEGKKLPAHYPIVIIDQNGETYSPVVQALEAKGFNNVYTVKEGLTGLQKENQ